MVCVPPWGRYVRSTTPRIPDGGRRRRRDGDAGRIATGRGRRSQLHEQRSRSAVSGKDLPTFKFALEKSGGKVIGNSFGSELFGKFPHRNVFVAQEWTWQIGGRT